jgi:succinate dehydrogenase / fumarate reductase cytochrome b subunit
MLGEIALVFAVIFHGVNGLRIAYFDMVRPKSWAISSERSSARWTLAVSIVLWLPAAFWMGRSLLIHNFGLFGG